VRHPIAVLWAEVRSSGRISCAPHCAPSAPPRGGRRYLAEADQKKDRRLDGDGLGG